jgi:alpha-1,3-mannosyltransferase
VTKILHVTTDYLPGTGGLERFVHELARHSRDAGLDASVLAMNRIAGRRDRLPAVDTIDGVPVTRVGFLNFHFYRPARLPIGLLTDADLIHVHGLGAHLDFVALTRRRHRRAIVLSTHGGIFHTDRLAAVKSIYFRFVRRFVLPRVDQIVACGQADHDLFTARGVTDLITIDNGVELRPWSRPAPARDPNRLLFVGRIAANKKVDDLIRTLAIIRKTRPVTLRIVGPDRSGLVDGLKTLADQLGIADAVTFTGPVSDEQLAAEYRQAAMFVSASGHEGFGLSAVEAMAAGTAVVLNDIPAFRVLVGDNRAHLTRFSEPVVAAETIRCQLQSPVTDRLQIRANDFAWPHVMPSWRRLYERLIASHLRT